jgi:hypothetical protein
MGVTASGENTMNNQRLFAMPFSEIYLLLVQKAERKGRTRAEVNEIIYWLTDYDENSLREQLEKKSDLQTFWEQAPCINDNVNLIKGVICGY